MAGEFPFTGQGLHAVVKSFILLLIIITAAAAAAVKKKEREGDVGIKEGVWLTERELTLHHVYPSHSTALGLWIPLSVTPREHNLSALITIFNILNLWKGSVFDYVSTI